MMFLNVILTSNILWFIRNLNIKFISRGLMLINIMLKRSSCHMTIILHQKSEMIDRINTMYENYVYVFLPYRSFCLACVNIICSKLIPFWFFVTCNIHTVKRSMINSSANISAKYYFAAAIKIKSSTSLNIFIFNFRVSLQF